MARRLRPDLAAFRDRVALRLARLTRAELKLPPEEAVGLIQKGSGSHFDPAIAAALVRLFDRGDLDLDDMPSEIRQMLPGT